MSRETVPARTVAHQATVASWLGIARTTFVQWVKKGAPVLPDGRYDLMAVAQWAVTDAERDAGEETREAAERRRVIALANKAELDVAERKAELVPIEQHRAERLAIIDSFCSSIEQLPAKLAPLLAGATTYEEIVAQLHAYTRSMRVQLAAKHSPPVQEQVETEEPSGATDASMEAADGTA